jgi:glutamyl-tRNA reductase
VALADKLGGRAVPLGELPDILTRVDVLLTATDSTEVHVERADVEAVMERRDGAPLLIVDVAVPRDVDPGAGQVPGVTLHDVDDLHELTEAALDERRREVGTVREIIGQELERFQTDRAARAVAPLVTELRARAESIRQGELARFRSKLDALPEDARAAVEALTQGIVNKMLHEPTVRLKDAAGTARGELYSDALGTLFDIRDAEE